MKPTSIGWLRGVRIPDGWREAKVKHLVSELKAGDTITAERIEPAGRYPVYGGNGRRGFADTYTHEGTRILIGRQGALCGNVHMVSGKFWASEHAIVATPIQTIEPRWFAHLLHVMDLGQYSQTAAQPGIGIATISALGVPVPSHAEQCAIADYLDRETAQIDALIAKEEQLVATLRERRRGITRSAVVRGFRKADAFQETGLPWAPSIPKNWLVMQIRHLGSTYSGSGFPPEDQGKSGLDYPFFKVKHLGGVGPDGALPASDDSIDESTRRRLGATLFPAGSLAYAKVGAALLLGRFGRLDQPSCLDNNMSGLRPRQGFNSSYLLAAFELIDFALIVNPGAVPSMSDKNFLAYKLPVPPFEEQQEIVGLLREQTAKIDLLISKAEQFIVLAKERRAALITAAVTGQIDVGSAA